MPVIQVNDQQFALPPGQTRVGAGSGVDVPIGDDDALGVQAIVDVASDAQAVIRRASPTAVVKVNGLPLGAEPTPLIHGDKVEIAGMELLYSEDRKGGATQYVSSSDIAELAQKRSGPARATAATGGRLVSLVDGKEYAVPAHGIVIGRDASSDVVVAQAEVSRRHAGIMPAENGYVLSDYSTNGVWVNGVRVQQTQLLSRADVVRVGSEEFRFYADVAPIVGRPTATPAVSGAAAVPPQAPSVPLVQAPAGAGISVPETQGSMAAAASAGMAGAASAPAAAAPPAAAPAPPPVPPAASVPMAARAPIVEPPTQPPAEAERPVLATLEIVNAGIDKGRRFDVRTPLVHIGRGPHNEIVLNEESVSDAHAKLQRRDDGWYVTDLGSTNGTYVGGSRITGEKKLEGAPDVRFGGVKMVFRPAAGAAAEPKGTRPIASVDRAAADRPTRVKDVATVPEPAAAKSGTPAWLWIAVAVVVLAIVAYFLLQK